MSSRNRLAPLKGGKTNEVRNNLAAAQYFEEHDIREHFTTLGQMLLVHQPKNALQFLHNEIGRMVEQQEKSKGKNYASAIPKDARGMYPSPTSEIQEEKDAEVRKQLALFRENPDTAPNLRFVRRNALTGQWTLYTRGGWGGKPSQIKYQDPDPLPKIGDLPAECEGCCFCQGVCKSSLEWGRIPANCGDCVRYIGQPGIPGARIVEDFSKAGSDGEEWAIRIVRNIFPMMSVCFAKDEFATDGNPRGFVEDQGDVINPYSNDPLYVQMAARGYNEVIVERYVCLIKTQQYQYLNRHF